MSPAASLLSGTGIGIGSGSGRGIGIGYGTNIAVGGTSPAVGGHAAPPNPSGIDAAAANDGALAWLGAKPGDECGHRGLPKSPRGKGDGRELGTGVDVGGSHGKLTFASPSGRLPPIT